MAKKSPGLIGCYIGRELGTGRDLVTSHAYDITDELPLTRTVTHPLCVAFVGHQRGEWTIILGLHHLDGERFRFGPDLYLETSQAKGRKRKRYKNGECSLKLTITLARYGLTPDSYKSILVRLLEEIHRDCPCPQNVPDLKKETSAGIWHVVLGGSCYSRSKQDPQRCSTRC